MRPASSVKWIVAVLAAAVGLVVWFARTDSDAPSAAPTTNAEDRPQDAPSTTKRAPRATAPATITGLVRRGDDGSVVGGVRVSASAANGKTAAVVAVSDERGRFRLERVPSEQVVDVRAVIDEFAPATIRGLRLTPGETREVGVLVLWPSASLTVRVLGPDGRPVDGADVFGVVYPREGTPKPKDVQGVTGADGVWAARDLEPCRVYVRAHKAGLASPQDQSFVEVTSGSAATVTLRLSRAWTLTGCVRDPAGQPIVGAIVALRQDDRAASSWAARGDGAVTDAEGRYRLADLAAGRMTLFAGWPKAELHGVGAVRVPAVTTFDFVLYPGGSVSGKVSNEAGEPVAGASVRASGRTRAAWAYGRADTDVDGRFEILGLPECPATYLQAEAKGYAKAWQVGEQFKPFALRPGDAVVRDLVLRRGARVTGTVTDEIGALPGAHVSLFGGGADRALDATTDSNGRYEFAGAPTGRVLVVADKPGWLLDGAPDDPAKALAAGSAPAALCVDVPRGGEARLDLVLGHGLSASGRVESAVDGKPVAGVRVSWYASRTGRIGGTALAGDDGSFRLTGIPAGREVLVQLDTPGFSVQGPQPKFTAETGHDVEGLVVRCGRSTASLTITGRVHDATGAVPEDVVVEIVDPWVIAWDRASASAAAERDGSFTVTADSWVIHETAKLRVAATARTASTTCTVQVPPGQSIVQADVLLPAGLTVNGVVVSGGAPVPGALVVVQTGSSRVADQIRSGASPFQESEVAAVADANGSFTLGGLAPGEIEIGAMVPGAAWRSVRVRVPRAEPITIETAAGADLAGVVVDHDGHPVGGAGVDVRTDDGGVAGLWGDHAETDAAGAFRFRELPRVPHHLAVSTGPSSVSFLYLDAGLFSPGRTDLKIEVELASSIAGRVVDAAGTPQAWMRMRAFSTSPDQGLGGFAMTVADGTFRMTGVKPGTYFVEAARDDNDVPGSRRVLATIADVAAGAEGVELVVRTGGVVAGVLTKGDGGPAPDQWVLAVPVAAEFAWTRERGAAGAAKTDRDGRFRIDGLSPDGRYALRTLDPSDQRVRVPLAGGENVAAGTTNVALTLSRVYVVTGRVRDASGAVVKVIQLRIKSVETGRERDVATDADGAFRVEGLVAGVYSAAAWLGDPALRLSKPHALGTFRADAGDVELRPTD